MTDFAFSALTLERLSDDETAVANRLLARIDARAISNRLKGAYYEGRQRVRDMNIAIPPNLRGMLEVAVGWPGTVVDVLEERLELEGFTLPDGQVQDFGIDDIVEDNDLLVESGMGNLDALVYGVSFITAGTGVDGEPNPLVTVDSPLHTTAEYDTRGRVVSAALSRVWDDVWMRTREFTLFLPDQTIRAERAPGMDSWTVVDRDLHQLGRVPVARLVNRRRASDVFGRSEITRAVRYYTDHAVRTMIGMEVNREFYSSPQRWIMGADERAFVGPDGQAKTAWETYLGRFMAISADENGTLPTVGQFSANSPQPYIEQMRMLSQMLAAESAVPPTQLGFVSDNPPSADSVRAMETRLVKRAERRQAGFGRAGWVAAIQNAVMVRDGELPDPLKRLQATWRDPSTPTRSAAADEVTKYVAAGILPAHSDITLKRAGFSPAEREQLMRESDVMSIERLVAQMPVTPPEAPTMAVSPVATRAVP